MNRILAAVGGAMILTRGGMGMAGPQERGWIAEGRLMEWSPGVEGGIPTYPAVTVLGPEDLPGDGQTDCSQAIQKAIDEAETPGAVVLPAGTFLLKQRLVMKSDVALRGAGLDKTHLMFDVRGGRGPGAISIRGQASREEIAIEDGLKEGSTRLTLASTAGLTKGALVWIWQESDPDLMFTKPQWRTEWGRRSMGQVAKVVEIATDTVVIDTPLRLSYRKELRPRLVTIRPMRGVGVERLHIKRLDQSEDCIIGLMYSENSWVKDCETDYCSRSHVSVKSSRHVTVENCYIHHAYNYGGGGHGYGVSFSACVSDCLVINNVFRTLRHAMITQTGANGNVFAYNYSFDVAGSDNAGKAWWHSTDISIHGHYTYATLFEGNLVQRAGVADYWGPAGPRMTLFRNRIASPERETDEARQKELGITRTAMGIELRDSSHMVNVIGNTLTEGRIRVDESCRDALVEGNLVDGRIRWNQVQSRTLPVSLFLKEKPGFWGGNRPWPGIGADVDSSGSGVTLPAQDWYRAIKRQKKAIPFKMPKD